MKKEFVITDQKVRFQAYEAVRAITKDPVMKVTITEYKKNRSAAQNSLYWAWLTDCENTTCNDHAGKTKDEWHLEFKEKSLLNIFLKDEAKIYARLLGALYQIKVDFGQEAYDLQYEFIIDKLSTTEANVAQFAEYLTDIERFCHSVGIQLRTDSDMYRQAMGKK
ncbi:MAG: recombination protein NinB [Methylobacter sp.]